MGGRAEVEVYRSAELEALEVARSKEILSNRGNAVAVLPHVYTTGCCCLRECVVGHRLMLLFIEGYSRAQIGAAEELQGRTKYCLGV